MKKIMREILWPYGPSLDSALGFITPSHTGCYSNSSSSGHPFQLIARAVMLPVDNTHVPICFCISNHNKPTRIPCRQVFSAFAVGFWSSLRPDKVHSFERFPQII